MTPTPAPPPITTTAPAAVAAEAAAAEPLSLGFKNEMAATWQWRLDTDPELVASLGLLSTRRSTHALDPRSPESFDQRLKWIEQALDRANAMTTMLLEEEGGDQPPHSIMSPVEHLSWRLYVAQLQEYVQYTKHHKTYLCCVNRLEGPQTDLPLYARYLPTKTRTQREFYCDFLKAIPVQLSQVQQLLTMGMSEKRVPPKISLQGVVEQIHGMIAGDLEAFRRPIADAFQLPEDEHLQSECEQLLHGQVKEAWQTFVHFLEADYLPNLRDEISATQGYPDGEQYYKDCLKFHTTTDMSPQEIHQLGLDEVARIRQTMNEIATSEGYEGRLDEYMEHLRTAKEFEPTDARTLLAHYRDITGRIYPSLLNLFHIKTLPRSPFEITETPSAHASMAPAAYYLAGSVDPTQPRPGRFYVNTSELATRRTYESEALALHEAIPGHHTQASIQGENQTLPDFRRYCEDRRYFEAPCRFPFYTGYIEGWGLHCETLGEELGLYKKPSDRMGQLSMEALRSCRLVVDTGMHALGWTREQALEFMLQNTAMGEHDAQTEVARYITWPGQATAYKVGERFLRRLRTNAEVALGSEFDPRDFYHVVLTCGPVPLNVLEELVNEYIDGLRSTSTRQGLETDKRVAEIMDIMTFANWCKCCVVPGTCS
jgi:uncharacterized protein (DUF885 family)